MERPRSKALGLLAVAILLACTVAATPAAAEAGGVPVWQRVSPVLAERGEGFAYAMESRSPDAPAALLDGVPTSAWTMTGDQDATLAFDVGGTAPGTYVYELWQVPGQGRGLVQDGTRYRLTLTVDPALPHGMAVTVQAGGAATKRASVGWTVRALPPGPGEPGGAAPDLWEGVRTAVDARRGWVPATGDLPVAPWAVAAAEAAVAAVALAWVVWKSRTHRPRAGKGDRS